MVGFDILCIVGFICLLCSWHYVYLESCFVVIMVLSIYLMSNIMFVYLEYYLSCIFVVLYYCIVISYIFWLYSGMKSIVVISCFGQAFNGMRLRYCFGILSEEFGVVKVSDNDSGSRFVLYYTMFKLYAYLEFHSLFSSSFEYIIL